MTKKTNTTYDFRKTHNTITILMAYTCVFVMHINLTKRPVLHSPLCRFFYKNRNEVKIGQKTSSFQNNFSAIFNAPRCACRHVKLEFLSMLLGAPLFVLLETISETFWNFWSRNFWFKTARATLLLSLNFGVYFSWALCHHLLLLDQTQSIWENSSSEKGFIC